MIDPLTTTAPPPPRPFVPLTAPGMPPPGKDFIDAAVAQGDPPPTYSGKAVRDRVLTAHGPILADLYYRATYDPTFQLTVPVRGTPRPAPFVPGHVWRGGAPGPRPAKVMVLGKWPGQEEVQHGRNFAGPSGQIVRQALTELGAEEREYGGWYVTNVVKHPNVDPQADKMPKAWVKNCLPILHQELRLVAPDYVLCFGKEAAETLLGDSLTGGVTASQGRVFEFAIPGEGRGDDGEVASPEKRCRAMVCLHPAAVARAVDQYPEFLNGLGQFLDLVRSGEAVEQEPLQVIRLYSARHLAAVVDEIVASPDGRDLAVDCEWHGDYPTEPNAWLRTLQFTHRPDRAYVVVFRNEGGTQAFEAGDAAAVPHLKRLFLDTSARRVRLIGHNLRADLPWIIALDAGLGEAMAEQYTAPPDDPGAATGNGLWGWEKTRTEGGFDTMLAVHSVQEVAGPLGFKLEVLAGRYCRLPRWDVALTAWKKEWCAERGLKAKDLDGYGDCPDDVLLGPVSGDGGVSYAGWDVAGLYRLFRALNDPGGLLDCDQFGHCNRKPYWIAMRASPAFLEMERTGFRFDDAVARELVADYQAAHARILAELRELVGYPEFNTGSVLQVRDLLFGPGFSAKFDADGRPKRFLPPGAVSLHLKPITTTGKPPKMWDDVVRRGEAHLFSPGTDKVTLGIYLANLPADSPDPAQKAAREIVGRLRDVRFLKTILDRVLMPKPATEAGAEDDGDEDSLFDRGLPAFTHADGRIRTHFFQTQETARVSTARPPLQNLCFGPGTEYLTQRGWVPVEQLLPEDKVAQFEPKGSTISLVRPGAVHVSQFDGDLVRWHGPRYDLLVTPNHRVPLLSAEDHTLTEVTAADALPAGQWRLLVAGASGGSESLTDEQATWIAAVIRFGQYDPAGTPRIRFWFRGATHAGRIEKLVEVAGRLGGQGRLSAPGKSAASTVVVQVGGAESKELVEWTAALLGPDPQLGEWLFRYTAAAIDAVVRALDWWASAKGTTRRRTASADERDWLQIAHVLSGRSSLANPKSGGLFSLQAVDRRMSIPAAVTTEAVPYAGPVYCVTVPSSWVVVRRNGRVMVSGNSKKREKDYARMLGDAYRHPIRAMLAAPAGYVGVEADYIGAELAMMAKQCGSAAMIDHCARSGLPDSHPDKYDIHSSIAVLAFQLKVTSEAAIQKAAAKLKVPRESLTVKVGDPLPASKTWLEAIGQKNLRDAAKTVVFGIPYGRGDDAVIRAVEEEGVKLTLEDAGRIREAIFKAYPELGPYLEDCHRRATDQRWLANWAGRHRRFQRTDDRKAIGEMERQAGNFPIQSGVADTVSLALDRLYHLPDRRDEKGLRFLFALQIHDAIAFHVRPDSVRWFLGTEHSPGVLGQCMTGVPIYTATLDGAVVPSSQAYYLPIEYGLYLNWGVPLRRADGLALGVPEEYLPEK